MLHRLPSFLELLRQLHIGAVLPVGKVQATAPALYKRLRKLPHEIFLRLLNDTTAALQNQHPLVAQAPSPVSFASKVYAIDDTTLDALMRRTQALRAYKKGAMETLAGRAGSPMRCRGNCWC